MNSKIEEIQRDIDSLADTECTCPKCVAMCNRRICWGTPAEMRKLIELGYSDRLMLDYWVGSFHGTDEDTYIVSPAIIGYGGKTAPDFPIGKCVLLENDRCLIHQYKPTEGRKGGACQKEVDPFNLHEYIARMWDTEEGREVVELWRERK